MNFMSNKVFRKIPSPLKNSPSKRKSLKTKIAVTPSQQAPPVKSAQEGGSGGGGGGSRPDVVPDGSQGMLAQPARTKESRGGRSVSLTRQHDSANSLDRSPSN